MSDLGRRFHNARKILVLETLVKLVTGKLGSISPTFYEQLLRVQIPKAQKRQSS